MMMATADDSNYDLTPPIETPGERRLGEARRQGGSRRRARGARCAGGGADALLRPQLEERREEWFWQVTAAIEDLRDRHPEIDVSELARNEEFVTPLHQAADAAMRTHHREKFAAVRNAVLNAAMPSAPHSHMQGVFIQLVSSPPRPTSVSWVSATIRRGGSTSAPSSIRKSTRVCAARRSSWGCQTCSGRTGMPAPHDGATGGPRRPGPEGPQTLSAISKAHAVAPRHSRCRRSRRSR